jgi:hypothetical protein
MSQSQASCTPPICGRPEFRRGCCCIIKRRNEQTLDSLPNIAFNDVRDSGNYPEVQIHDMERRQSQSEGRNEKIGAIASGMADARMIKIQHEFVPDRLLKPRSTLFNGVIKGGKLLEGLANAQTKCNYSKAAKHVALGDVQRLAWAGAFNASKILENGYIVHPPFFGVDHPFL